MAMFTTKEAWSQLEPSPPHLTYLFLGAFLIPFTLWSNFIHNRLHLSVPPLALLVGIILGPLGAGVLVPNTCGIDGCLRVGEGTGGWHWGDGTMQEVCRVIVAIQVFSVGIELPRKYFNRHWRSVLMLLGPVMFLGWIVSAVLIHFLFQVCWRTSLIIAAPLTPTDPVLAASILSNSIFSKRVPVRIRHLLSAESGCNDGVSFPFLYIGIYYLTKDSAATAWKDWFLITVLWQCLFGVFIGFCIGWTANHLLRYSERKRYIDNSGLTVFYFLLALLATGVGSTLGLDDFLVAFAAGIGFGGDGWFAEQTKETELPQTLDLLTNSSMFIYLGTAIPWYDFHAQAITPYITPLRLLLFLVLVLLFRRIPAVLLCYRFTPDIHTLREAYFVGHFGPMGLGALFLAIMARAELENGTSTPDSHPPHYSPPYTTTEGAVMLVWPIVCFTVMGSTIVHGLSVLVLSTCSHYSRPMERRSSLFAAEQEPLRGMNHYNSDPEGETPDDENAPLLGGVLPGRYVW